MAIKNELKDAGVSRVLVVDDDLATQVTLRDLDATGRRPVPSELLADETHPLTEELDALLARRGLPHATDEERAAALRDDAVRAEAPEFLRNAYARALERRLDAGKPLATLLTWLKDDFGIKAQQWSQHETLEAGLRFDLLIVDYYLVDERFDATRALITAFKEAHANEDKPLLVILMSSNVDQLIQEFEQIRDDCRLSAARFRILAKPASATEAADKEKWARALSSLARERPLVGRIEAFVSAWESSLRQAAEKAAMRLNDLDAGALSMLIDTAKLDNMSFEEYLCDVIARRINAEAESNSFPFDQMQQLETALSNAGINVALDQGVEVRHGQRAIRALMSDVIWHRAEWWRPNAAVPPIPPAVAGDNVSEEANKTAKRHRYVWMKRHVRFGTVLRNTAGEIFLNITQACDVQSVKLEAANLVNFLFVHGKQFAVDKVAEGEKAYDSPYYCEDLKSDQFYTLQWQLRRPFTPSLLELCDSLHDYEITAQLRLDAAYAVLAKFVSQASRVALVRLPALHECSVELFHKPQGQPWSQVPLTGCAATAWNRRNNEWRIQFSVDSTNNLINALASLDDAGRAKVRDVLAKSVKCDVKRTEYHSKPIADGAVLLVKMDGRTTYDQAKAITYIADQHAEQGFTGAFAVLVRGTPAVDG